MGIELSPSQDQTLQEVDLFLAKAGYVHSSHAYEIFTIDRDGAQSNPEFTKQLGIFYEISLLRSANLVVAD